MSSSVGGRGKAKMQCFVLLLDGRQLTVGLSPRAFGQELYEAVHRDLQLVETDYFGLEFKATDDTNHWLDKVKPIGIQTGSTSNIMFAFKVKFYPADPTMLKEEYTRYLFALQLRDDLVSGRLQCCGRTAALLAAYVVQSELGDYESVANSSLPLGSGVASSNGEAAYLRSIKLIAGQTAELERSIAEVHRSLSGLKPAEADSRLLDAARKTDFYGVVLNSAKDADGVPQSLAVTEAGILVYQNNQRVNVFSWAKIRELCFRRKRFLIKLRPAADKAHPANLVEFAFPSRNRAKAFWKLCVEHHAFFCCQEAPVHQTKQWRSHVLTRGSTFRYSGRTQVQLIDHVKDNLVKSRPFARSRSFGTMASSPSCGSASLGSVARTLPAAFRDGMPACNTPTGASSTLTGTPGFNRRIANVLAGPQLPPKDGGAAERPLAETVAAVAAAAATPAGPATPAAADHAALIGKVASQESRRVPDVATATPLQQTQSGMNASGEESTSQLVNVNGTGAVELAVELCNHDDGVPLSSPSSSSSMSSSARATNADGNDSIDDDVVDDADSLAKLEDAIRSLAAAELKVAAAGGSNGDADSRGGGFVGVESTASLKRRLAQSAVDAERAARQQARDEVLLACRASSLRRSLRRSSTRSAEEEMAQLEDVSDIAAKVMHSAANDIVGSATTEADDRGLSAGGKSRPTPQVLGRGQRLSSLQDLCDLASKVMQYDNDLAASAPLLQPQARGNSGEPAATPTAVRQGLSPSPPPLPAKQQPPQHRHDAVASSTEPPWTGRLADDADCDGSLAAPASFSAANMSAGDTACEAPPLPPKCNSQPLHGSLPRNFLRGNRTNHGNAWKTATAPRQQATADAAALVGAVESDSAGRIDTAIRLPTRTRPAATSSSSSSSSSSTSSSSSSSSLHRAAAGRDAQVYRLGHGGTVSAVVSTLAEPTSSAGAVHRGSAAIDDELEAALSATASLVITPAASTGLEALPVAATLPGGDGDSERASTIDESMPPPPLQPRVVVPTNSPTAVLAGDGAADAGQMTSGQSWSCHRSLSAPLSPDVDDVFVDDPVHVASTALSADHCEAVASACCSSVAAE